MFNCCRIGIYLCTGAESSSLSIALSESRVPRQTPPKRRSLCWLRDENHYCQTQEERYVFPVIKFKIK